MPIDVAKQALAARIDFIGPLNSIVQLLKLPAQFVISHMDSCLSALAVAAGVALATAFFVDDGGLSALGTQISDLDRLPRGGCFSFDHVSRLGVGTIRYG